ncbi:MAG: PilZ domain-containing protein [Oscillospiraceae bacterium]|nr:PilZ domain-containing protein [Oscillospiraceae bacterium]
MNNLKKYVSSMCEVKTIDNELLMVGIFNGLDEDNHIEIVSPSVRVPFLGYGTPLKVQIYNYKLGLCIIQAKIYISGDHFIKLADMEYVAPGERRTFYRVPVSIMRNMEVVEEKGAPRLAPVEIEIVDISLSGLGFKTEYAVDPDRKYTLKLPLARRECEVVFEIVRFVDSVDGVYHYGCKFDKMKTADSDALCAFIFENQREQIRKQREAAEQLNLE